ncbi:AEC family transporter [Rugosibacter aromaticivorans]|nr:AEC family transporter [Rugosibacter aromaticivorans]
MYQQLIPMTLVLLLGVLWRHMSSARLPSAQVRSVLGILIINFVAPALIVEVMLTSNLKQELFQVPASGNVTIMVILLLSLALYVMLLRLHIITRVQAGALVLASTFGNGMGMALPAVSALLGLPQRDIPVVYDLLATVPFVWIIGVLLCAHFGTRVASGGLGKELLRLPPFWALAIALGMRYFGLVLPDPIMKTLHLLGSAAVPLLLLMVGMTLHVGREMRFGLLIPVVGLKLFLSAGLAFGVGHIVGLQGATLAATVLTAAAPPVGVGVALCDRFHLDTELFGTAMTMTTVLYVVLVPWLVSWLA